MRVNCDLQQMLSSSILPTHIYTHGLQSIKGRKTPCRGGESHRLASLLLRGKDALEDVQRSSQKGNPHIPVKIMIIIKGNVTINIFHRVLMCL